MTQSDFDTMTLNLITLYYGTIDEVDQYHATENATGPLCYFEAERKLAEDFPELREVWWRNNGWRFSGGVEQPPSN